VRVNRLLIVGDSPSFDDVADLVTTGSTCVVERCASPSDLLLTVANARLTHFRGDFIDVLDIHDHSSENGMLLGAKGDSLFDVTDGVLVGAELARNLGAHLRATAHLRLLGCDVVFESNEPKAATPKAVCGLLARHLDRRYLLIALAESLGSLRIVLGTNCNVNYYSFTAEGLGTSIEQGGLFSSLAAVHADPCGFTVQGERLERLQGHARPFR
jgi:hypothetical protein